MNSRHHYTARLISTAAIALCVSCAQTSIGVDPCNDGRTDCGARPLQGGASTDQSETATVARFDAIEMEPLTEITPTWIKALPSPGLPRPDSGANSPFLESDRDGNLMYFAPDAAKRSLYLIPLDDDGNGLENIMIAKPTEWNPYPSGSFIGPCQGEMCGLNSGVGARVSWIANCGPDGSVACNKYEKVFFGADLHAAPVRAELPAQFNSDVAQNADGDLFVVATDPDNSVTKLEAGTQRPLWTRTDFASPTPYPDQVFKYSIAGVALDDGRFVVGAMSGAIGEVLFISVIAPDGTMSRLQGIQQGQRPLLLNAKDHAVVAVSTLVGDMSVTRISDATHLEGLTFRRNDYTQLMPSAAAVDPTGNVYVGLHSGSRDDPRPTLCKVPVDGKGSCYTLPANAGTTPEESLEFKAIVARDGGELFIHSHAHLVRVSYPE